MNADTLSALWPRLAGIRDCSVPDRHPFWIYGAGGFGRRLARELVRLGRPVLGFIDLRARELGRIDGLPCLHPDDLTDGQARSGSYLHGLMNHAVCVRDVAEWAARRGFAEVRFPAALFAIPGFALDNYWFGAPERILRNREAIAWLHEVLADDESRALLEQLLLYRVTTDPRLHPPVGTADFYRPDFLRLRGRPLTFVDGGAFSGDTLEILLESGVEVRDWVAFEPDPTNMAALIGTADRLRDAVGRYTLMNAGLSDQTGEVRFAQAKGEASHIARSDAEGGSSIKVFRFDDVVRCSGDVYVKLDIEGAELAALHGMAKLLQQRPMLAVSVYHEPEHLWTIPQAIAALYPRPCLRLRQHLHNGFDTVLYVTPGD